MKLKPIFYNLIKPIKVAICKKGKPYKLVSREIGLDFNSRKFPELLFHDEATSVDIVVIASTKNPEKTKTITTFKDKEGNILERAFESIGFNLPEKRQVYKNLKESDKNNDKKIIQIYENLNQNNGLKVWQKIETSRVFKHRDCGKVWLANVIKVFTPERTIREAKKETHFFASYYPKSMSNGGSNKTKTLTLQIEKDENMIPQIVGYSHSENFAMPKNDEYLAFRAYDAESVKKPITRFALKKFGLKDIKIYIEDNFNSKEKHLGSFSEEYESIFFNYKTDSKNSIIDTAFHEAKHAFQYAVINLFGLKNKYTNYAQQCLKNLKWKKTEGLKKKAEDYFKAHEYYISPNENYTEYRRNLLEAEAWSAGTRFSNDYLYKSKELSNELPGVFWHEL